MLMGFRTRGECTCQAPGSPDRVVTMDSETIWPAIKFYWKLHLLVISARE